MNIFQKLIKSFFNIKIVYKFLSVLGAFVIGLILITYIFESGLDIGQQTLSSFASDAAIHAKSKENLKQLLNPTESLLANPAIPEHDKFEQLKTIVTRVKTELGESKNASDVTQVQTETNAAYQRVRQLFILAAVLVFVLITALIWLVVNHGVVKPVTQLQTVIQQIAQGNLDARAGGYSHDELGTLAYAFDLLLDERVTTLAKTESENQQLNTSIIALLRAVSILSRKDLTVNVPVAEDMTGAVSDSINLLTSEIAATLREVAQIATQVNTISGQVKQQSGDVMIFAENQHKELELTLEELNTAVNTMVKIAQFSQVTKKESEKTMLTTESAVEAVTQTVASINGIRDIIRETEKRIKRLGERSQEITGVVNIINNIAERTHVLSLNAGMQAAAAGEAGKAFMVVANEVQRLAESSREATEKIATLVKNIQVDTSDTMKTMNSVISQVVDGTEQAEEAGRRMKESRATTQSLIEAVKKIAVTTIAQLDVGKSLKEHAQNIQTSTIQTNAQLQQQRDLSDDLAAHTEELLLKVHVFKLPE